MLIRDCLLPESVCNGQLQHVVLTGNQFNDATRNLLEEAAGGRIKIAFGPSPGGTGSNLPAGGRIMAIFKAVEPDLTRRDVPSGTRTCL